jgi:mRNA interferase YafQ
MTQPLAIFTTSRFEKDYKRARRNPDWRINDLKEVIRVLAVRGSLARKHRDHKLTGEYDDCRECHIRPDWLLIYRIDPEGLHLIRTGSHADLFG